MRYVSTRGGVAPIAFQPAVLMGLADDGGLLIPESIPDVSDRLDDWRALDYPALAFEVMRLYATDVPDEGLRTLVEATYGASYGGPVAPTVQAGPLHVLELFHGPTLAFKDVALQFLGNLFSHILGRTGRRLNILCATSGDTGSAAIYGCRGRPGIDIFILHPHGRVSPIQERQMTTVLDENVHNIAIEGIFDDCQAIVKTLASDLEFKAAASLGAVNSINWARVLAQIVYYFRACFDTCAATGADRVRFCVPTGNFGDILAAWYALRMGLPIERLILATNENDILAGFFRTGRYERGALHRTLAPAMDIQVSSNFERYLYHRVGRDAGRLRTLMQEFARSGALAIDPGPDGVVDAEFVADSCTMDDCLDTIRRWHRDHGYLLDPHTAVGVAVAARRIAARQDAGSPIVCVGTAHPAKFPDAIRRATGRDPAPHPAIDALMDRPTRCAVLPNDPEAVRRAILSALA
ncbi:MAG: threonine synthase [Candidatus Brocadiaceae bacterium]|nr:threonine synthase [Candidatus Brocadiaceae bacterium]